MIGAANLSRVGSKAAIPPTFSSAVVEAIAAHLTLPRPLEMGVYGPWRYNSVAVTAKQPIQATPTFSSEFVVVFRRDGTVKSLELSQQSQSPALEAAIARAIKAADSARDFPLITDATDKRELPVFIDFFFSDSLSAGSYAMFRASVPIYVASNLVKQLPTFVPEYPKDLRRQGISGDVVLDFVVDESGQVAERSYRIVKLSDVPFGEAVLAALPKMRFEPMRIGGCAVKALVEQSFAFRLDKPATQTPAIIHEKNLPVTRKPVME
jgi:TonB family protein